MHQVLLTVPDARVQQSFGFLLHGIDLLPAQVLAVKEVLKAEFVSPDQLTLSHRHFQLRKGIVDGLSLFRSFMGSNFKLAIARRSRTSQSLEQTNPFNSVD